ncbi:RNA polymerase sigma factor [Cellulomonas carbonis]|uniref:RNA polymerase sigma factor n=1 Tax=Cellulomonas carbonis T26 TaxID=947969 RepID=A0A0A0BK30_9CELL|nr:sigma-70 family RNA polymerase sigma factor [Cellulomonas carbonis]KGM08873.1 RNA polymerase sigma factor [Cellulomonas carbonis T26]
MAGEPSRGGGRTSASPEPSTWDTAATAFRAWRDGVPGGLDELVTTMTPVLWHVVRAYGLGRAQAEDVVQTTWVALVRNASSVADPQAVAAWLTTTARREAWRVARRGRADETVDDEVLERLPDARPSVEHEVVARDEDERLWASVRRLPERCRRLLRVVAFEDRPDYAGIARDLGMPIGSIGPTRGRCLAKLRALLAEGGAP